MKNFYFISGLPRTGSTLLSAILKQNPKFYAGITSPMRGIFDILRRQISSGHELSEEITYQQKINLLRGAFENFYAHESASTIFDTNRLWTANLTDILTLFPNTKVICMVRDISWIMDSFEIQYQKNTLDNTLLFKSNSERETVYSRMGALAKSKRVIGASYLALKEAFYGINSDKLLLIEYDYLSNFPEKTISTIYNFIEEQSYEHNFNNLNFTSEKYDKKLGLKELHSVRKQLSFKKRESILPPDLFDKYSNMEFWKSENSSKAKILIKNKGESFG
jgi:sulfotransferase